MVWSFQVLQKRRTQIFEATELSHPTIDFRSEMLYIARLQKY